MITFFLSIITGASVAIGGANYVNAKVTKENGSLKISHEAGIKRIPFHSLSALDLARYKITKEEVEASKEKAPQEKPKSQDEILEEIIQKGDWEALNKILEGMEAAGREKQNTFLLEKRLKNLEIRNRRLQQDISKEKDKAKASELLKEFNKNKELISGIKEILSEKKEKPVDKEEK